MPKMRFEVDPGEAHEEKLKSSHDVPGMRFQVVGPEGDHLECFWCHEVFPVAWGLRFCPRCGFSVDDERGT
jgi:hypothetical protein